MRDIVIRYWLPYEAHLASLIRLNVPPYEATGQAAAIIYLGASLFWETQGFGYFDFQWLATTEFHTEIAQYTIHRTGMESVYALLWLFAQKSILPKNWFKSSTLYKLT